MRNYNIQFLIFYFPSDIYYICLKKFSTHTEYEAYIASEGKVLPNVSICKDTKDVHYNPWVAPETRVVAKFNVTDTSNPTKIANGTSNFSEIEIDGSKQPSVTTGYTFDTVGEHTVKYTLTDPTSIGAYAFNNCSGLTSIDIPDSVTSINYGTFANCSGLTSINIPNSVTSVDDLAFYQCSSLTSCTIGSGVTSIDKSAFARCTSLTSCTIGSGVTSIGDSVFSDCTSLTSCTIGSGVTSIGKSAFWSCTSFTSVTVEATTPPTLGRNAFSGTASGMKIYVPAASVEAYKAATNWSAYVNDIEPIS